METKKNILTLNYEFLKFTIALIKNFPRDQKFLIGDRMQNIASELMEIFIEAYYSNSKKKKKKLQKANILLEKMRFYIRLCYELGYYNSSKYAQIMKQVQEIGRITGGWIKSLS